MYNFVFAVYSQILCSSSINQRTCNDKPERQVLQNSHNVLCGFYFAMKFCTFATFVTCETTAENFDRNSLHRGQNLLTVAREMDAEIGERGRAGDGVNIAVASPANCFAIYSTS